MIQLLPTAKNLPRGLYTNPVSLRTVKELLKWNYVKTSVVQEEEENKYFKFNKLAY
jgi:hypothetical protein